MSEFNNVATCWDDQAPLERDKKERDTWSCTKCHGIYYSCFACEESEETMNFESNESAKGWACDRCMRWHCAYHFQNTGESFEEAGDWYCNKCAKSRSRIVHLAKSK